MILLFSLFPQSLVQSISDAVAPHYAMPRQWIGDRITNAAGHWNGFLVMNILGAVLLVLLMLVLLIRGLPSWPPSGGSDRSTFPSQEGIGCRQRRHPP